MLRYEVNIKWEKCFWEENLEKPFMETFYGN